MALLVIVILALAFTVIPSLISAYIAFWVFKLQKKPEGRLKYSARFTTITLGPVVIMLLLLKMSPFGPLDPTFNKPLAVFGLFVGLVTALWYDQPTYKLNPLRTFGVLALYFLVMVSVKAPLDLFFKPWANRGPSMEDTLQPGDYILARNDPFGLQQPYRGELLIFKYPGDRKVGYIKRCVGLPGDVVEIRNKSFYLNGQKMEESYVKQIDPMFIKTRDQYGPVTITENHYFMLGDNRDNSADSRSWGLLERKDVIGKVWFRYWRGPEKRLVCEPVQ